MGVIARSKRIFALLHPDSHVELLASGFEFTEGPVWNDREKFLLFSDIPGNVIRCWDPTYGVKEWRRPSNMANGLTYDAEWRLIACEAASSKVTRTELDGTINIIASHFDGKELNSPNDVIVRSDGSIYFTDPPSGRSRPHGVPRPRELEFQGVFRIPPDGGPVELLIDDFDTPNGLCFSPDESVLYVNDSLRMHIRVFDVQLDGSIENGRVFFVQDGHWPDRELVAETLRQTGKLDHGLPDGMKVDEYGNVYCTGHGGIWIISPSGEHLGTLEVSEIPANISWGGSDFTTLFICATRSLYRVQMRVRGCAPGSRKAD